jgi:uncharacterized protein YbjT (DUF2867 family)
MQAFQKIAVAGATGRVGRHVVEVLAARGHEVRAMSRSTGVDLVTGQGLAESLAGVSCIIDVASGASPEQQAATEFFTAATRNLHRFGEQAGVQRMVVVSIIGTDRFHAGYIMAKLAHEKEALSGPIPAQVLRAAQFHEFVGPFMEWGRRGDVIQVQKMRVQPVAARAVAEALVELATAPTPASGWPAERILEIAGPRPEDLVELAARLVARRGEKVRVEGVSNPADPDQRLYEEGALLPGPRATLAGPTFGEWLATT